MLHTDWLSEVRNYSALFYTQKRVHVLCVHVTKTQLRADVPDRDFTGLGSFIDRGVAVFCVPYRGVYCDLFCLLSSGY